jgi:hypothetical protein
MLGKRWCPALQTASFVQAMMWPPWFMELHIGLAYHLTEQTTCCWDTTCCIHTLHLASHIHTGMCCSCRRRFDDSLWGILKHSARTAKLQHL